ncbi:MAG: hypothetical protein L6R37_004319 [Teloschistes peruensis]|nr:MAG: hypothetical protein L6R37_004319 [Teloschistes peruensis]
MPGGCSPVLSCADQNNVFYILYGLLVNYNAARETGLPFIILPVDCGNPLWLIVDRKIVQFVRRIPFCSGTFTRFNWRGWEIWDRYRAHEELGDAILLVTPGKNYLQLCDADAVSDIFQRRADFLRPPEATGADETSPSTTEDSSSYGEALRIILDRCIPLIVLGRKNLSKSWLPKSFRELYQATLVFQEHMTEAYEAEKQAMMRNNKLENNLMTSLVRASLAKVDEKGSTTASRQEGLTEEEVYGNVFVFNFAGHDATANSLAIGICLLATRPDIQDWIAEEINTVLAGIESTESSYEDTFPLLPRCLAVVFETVRLYTAVAIAKSTGPKPQPLKLGGHDVLIPKNTVIIPNYSALHTHPRYWGPNSLDFEPSRWITSHPPNSQPTSPSHPTEHFREPATRNSPFVGWSGGARSCPGRKFAQVEFVGVLVGLFRNFRVSPVPVKGEEDSMARARLLEQIRRDTGMRLLLQMLHPEKAVLAWSKR